MPQHLIEILERTSRTYATRPAMRVRRQGLWVPWTWFEYREQIFLAARGLIALGVEAGNGLVIHGHNCPGWMVSHFSAIAAGAIPTGIYANSSAAQTAYVAEHCEAVVAVVQNRQLLEGFLAIRSNLPHLRSIVLLEDDHPDDGVVSWQRLLELGRRIPMEDLRRRIGSLEPDDLCELIYTSGTTGRPKAVMLTHRNVLWVADRLIQSFEIGPEDDLISYLPLSHIAEQVLSLYAAVFTGACIWFVESLEQVGENLREIRPHMFFAVPRVWEKIQARIEAVGAARPRWQRRISAWARRQGLAGGYAEQRGERKPWRWTLANRLVFSRLRQRLGLDRARGCFTAAAPISIHTLEFFLSLGIPVLEIYGMSENTGPATLSTPDCYRTGKAGRPIEGTEMKIELDGEICMRGPHISRGYYKDPVATREAFDAEGWLHSGDIGEIDAEGFLSITDRKKDLIITSGGKNIAPQPIESQLRSIDIVGQAVVIGDRRNYLSALLTLDPERIEEVAERLGSPANTLEDAATCPHIRNYLEREVERINRSLARFETVKRISILPLELSVAKGEVTPTLKLRRRVIEQRYAAEIESLYR